MPDRIAEIRARLDAATPGPWLRHPSEPWVYAEIMGTRAKRIIATELYKGDRNADLITHAPTDIAWLLDEVARLRLLVPCENCGEQGDSDECAYCGATAGAA